jgi:GntR family transcriptional regulator / MocR family aminotransferase
VRDSLFHIRRDDSLSIHSQIRKMLVSAILDGHLAPGMALPSCRKMSNTLGVARNTVALAYQSLVDDGYLLSRERSGYYINSDIVDGRSKSRETAGVSTDTPDWESRFGVHPSGQRNIDLPNDWLNYPYPFIYGHIDKNLFPLTEWRECSRQALSKTAMEEASCDNYYVDDASLVEQICKRLLPRRGIRVNTDQILVTLGCQNAIYLLASLMMNQNSRVAIEDPGYPDVRNIFSLKTPNIIPIPVDEEGLPVDERLDDCDFVFVTPSHQSPTTVTMPLARREALLKKAREKKLLIIEDDYEPEANFFNEPTPAIKSLDDDDRVIYVGSLSKSIFPGLRVGYLVGHPRLIEEARALRRLMFRHPPNSTQRTVSLFLSLGHHDTLVHRLHRAYRARWQLMEQALAKHMPDSFRVPTYGGSSFWVRGPEGLDADELARKAQEKGVIMHPGRVFFAAEDAPKNYFRLGYGSIPIDRIEAGIATLTGLIKNP